MAEHAPTVLTHPLLANLLVEAAVDTINVFRRSDSPDEVAHAASTTVETLAALFIDMGDALDHIVRLPDGWSHEAMAERVLPLLKEDPDLPEIPEDLGETERQAAIIVLTFNRIISGMIAAFAELSEQERIDPTGDLSDFCAAPSVQMEIAGWTALILGPEDEEEASPNDAE